MDPHSNTPVPWRPAAGNGEQGAWNDTLPGYTTTIESLTPPSHRHPLRSAAGQHAKQGARRLGRLLSIPIAILGGLMILAGLGGVTKQQSELLHYIVPFGMLLLGGVLIGISVVLLKRLKGPQRY